MKTEFSRKEELLFLAIGVLCVIAIVGIYADTVWAADQYLNIGADPYQLNRQLGPGEEFFAYPTDVYVKCQGGHGIYEGPVYAGTIFATTPVNGDRNVRRATWIRQCGNPVLNEIRFNVVVRDNATQTGMQAGPTTILINNNNVVGSQYSQYPSQEDLRRAEWYRRRGWDRPPPYHGGTYVQYQPYEHDLFGMAYLIIDRGFDYAIWHDRNRYESRSNRDHHNHDDHGWDHQNDHNNHDSHGDDHYWDHPHDGPQGPGPQPGS